MTVTTIAVDMVVAVATMTTDTAATTLTVAVAETMVAMTTATAEAVVVDVSTVGTMVATTAAVMITVTTMALTEAVLLVAAVVVTVMVPVKNATLVAEKNVVEVVRSAVAVATTTVMPTLPATNRPLPVKAVNPTTVVAPLPVVDLTKVAVRRDTAAGKFMNDS